MKVRIVDIKREDGWATRSAVRGVSGVTIGLTREQPEIVITLVVVNPATSDVAMLDALMRMPSGIAGTCDLICTDPGLAELERARDGARRVASIGVPLSPGERQRIAERISSGAIQSSDLSRAMSAAISDADSIGAKPFAFESRQPPPAPAPPPAKTKSPPSRWAALEFTDTKTGDEKK